MLRRISPCPIGRLNDHLKKALHFEKICGTMPMLVGIRQNKVIGDEPKISCLTRENCKPSCKYKIIKQKIILEIFYLFSYDIFRMNVHSKNHKYNW